MTKFSRNFIAGRMNKVVDQRLLPEGEYVDAMNVRMGSTEQSEIGVIENTKGNIPLTELRYIDGTQLSIDAKCIGAIEDSANETIYWFVHDSNFPVGDTGKLDMILSYNVFTGILMYHVISIDDGGGVNTTLNFNPLYLITGVNIIGDFLYFTDNYNAPRFINVKRNYLNPVANVDQITAEELLVIKKPPTESPTVELINTSGQSNYLETRFISFAYRYRYADGEYSATSQWSDVAFTPSSFNFSPDSFLNEGMVNQFNTANVTYNTGGPLVVGIDLLFKEANSNTIKVIDTFEKNADYASQTYSFSDSKIFTILSEAELLRLYDNVPRYAQAQTIMGNRLMYGNYIEGYDLKDKNDNPVKLEYSTELITTNVGAQDIPTRLAAGNYTLDFVLPVTINDSVVYLNLNGLPLTEGASISLDIRITHSAWGTLPSPPPSVATTQVDASFTFILQQSYTSVYQLATSVEFQQFIGTSLPGGNIKPVYSPITGVETSCAGSTFTDQINCNIQNFTTLSKWGSGIDTIGLSNTGQAIKIITSPGSNEIGLQLVGMIFSDDLNNPSTANYYYEYYKMLFANATYQKVSTPRSLHSNRGYQVGIVYMDEFNRSTTALVSNLNDTVHVPCGFSIYQNQIRVTIPITQIAPSWAKRYKFVIKPDMESYDVIYTNLFFTDKDTNATYFLLEGENTRKVEVGDRYIVKADTNGPLPNCEYATVLEKESKASNFITNPVVAGTIPAGVYMKMKANSFSIDTPANSYIDAGWRAVCAPKGGFSERLQYPMNIDNPSSPGSYIDYSIPAGSRIIFDIKFERAGTGASCERRGYVLQKTYISTNNYDNMYDWFIGDNIALTLNTGYSLDGVTTLTFLPTLRTDFAFGPDSFDTCYFQFFRNTSNNQLTLGLTTGISCTGWPDARREYCVDARIEVYRSVGLIIFETQPKDALPDVFYENNLSFAIDDYGNHMGNVQDQDIAGGVPAIIDTKFFNCFAFGNGAESYKIRDSLVGRSFNLGERVNVVAAQEYKEANRFADITYSGIYNAETNVNKLNEFNLGLLDYKNLETSFGPIYKMDGRETDVLVLQEDKISYVLSGKNLLSDSTGGGAIASVPEVLGTQIARTEKYGISFNPESYVHWGGNRYFTDVKRGAVLQLMGDSYSSDQIKIISEQNMRTWFRDLFNNSFSTQKLGGFDPYMNEYVLTSNDTPIPTNPQCLACGITQTVSISEPLIYCVDLGSVVGQTTISWTVVSNTGGDFVVSVEYATNTYSSGPVSTDDQITFYKNLVSVETAIVTITPSSNDLVLQITAECPVPEELTIIEIVVANNTDATKQIHTQYRYTNGTYTSALQSNLVTFASGTSNPLVSRYNVTSGYVGTGIFPPESSTMSMISNKISPDDFVFNPLNDKFRYLRSNVIYTNTPANILAAIGLSSIATPIIGAAPTYQANFTVPNKTLGDILYLIWDMRDSIPAELCYSNDKTDPKKDACCNCEACTTDCLNVTVTNLSSSSMATIDFGVTTGGACEGSPFTVDLDPSETASYCIETGTDYEVTDGSASITLTECATCSTYVYKNPSGSGITAQVEYKDCLDGSSKTISINTSRTGVFCCQYGIAPNIIVGSSANLYKTNGCKCCVTNTCTEWMVQVTSPTAFLGYISCSGGEASKLYTSPGTYYLCVISSRVPTVISGTCTITPVDACKDKTKCSK